MEGSFVSAVVLLLRVCDPLGKVPSVVGALREMPPERRRRVILRACLIPFVVLVNFAFFGHSFLELLGLSEFSLQIDAAVVLMLVALRRVFPTPDGSYGIASL